MAVGAITIGEASEVVQEAAGGGDGRDVDEHAWTDMDPTEGLPVAIERPAIFGAARVVVEDRFGELGLGLGFEIMQVEQARQLRPLGASALGVNGLVGGDDLSTGHHGPGLDDCEWPDLRAVLDRRGLSSKL